ncbi:MAG: hypothetical protein E7510_04750 [Ruminococcus sp.]|nr:hypothetical protein [Ruminococcus sp.]
MGRFFTSTQILNEERLGKDDFLKKFCEKMKEEGYVKCDEEESAEISYVFAFSENEKCKWVTMSSESYETGNAKAEKDTSRVAKMLGTICINTVVIDSDCAILNLYDKSGKNADMFAIGIADDYLGDDIPEPKKEIWEKLLNEECDWEQLMEICQESDAEGGLSEIASIIDADEELILFEAGGIFDYNADVVTVGFKKKTAEKKLSLYAGFKKVYGEYLEPYGFKLVKSKHPYFVRVVDNEIVQIVSIMKSKSTSKEAELFEIYVGISLLSLPLINFDKNPLNIDNQICIESLKSLFHRYSKNYDAQKFSISAFSIPYESNDNHRLINSLKLSIEKLMPFIFEVFGVNTTLDNLYKWGLKMSIGCFNDVVILTQKVDDYLKLEDEKLKKEISFLEEVVYVNDIEMLEIASKDITMCYEKEKRWFKGFKNGSDAYEKYVEKSYETKNKNLNYLTEMFSAY